MSETLNYIAEFVQTRPHETLKFRDSLIANASGLGPPDLCILYKTYQGSLSSGHTDTHEYGHWVVGANNSSPEAISSYFEKLLAEQPSNAWYSTGSFRILGGVYCTYDCFSHLDVRVDLNLRSDSYLSPGVTAYAVDDMGRRSPPTSEIWKSLFVSAGLRSVAFPPSYVPCLHTLDAYTTEKRELFYNEASELLERGYTTLRGTEDADVDVVCALMHDYMKLYSRSEDIIKFFTPIAKSSGSVAAYIADAYANIGGKNGMKDAVSILLRTLRTKPFSPPLLRELIKHLLSGQRGHLALPLAKTCVEQDPLNPLSWISLARVYFKLRKPSMVLIALNGLPLKFRKPTNDLEALVDLPADIPATRLTTPPQKIAYSGAPEWWFYDSDRIHREEYPEEYVDSDDEDDADLRASFSDKPKLKGASLDETSLQAYRILSDLEQALGWPKLVKICRKIFYMSRAGGSGGGGRRSATSTPSGSSGGGGSNNNQMNIVVHGVHDSRLYSSDSRIDLQSELSQYDYEQRRTHEQVEEVKRKLNIDDLNGSPAHTSSKPLSLHELQRLYSERTDDDGSGLGFAAAFMPLSPQPGTLQADVSLTSTVENYESMMSPRRRSLNDLADEASGFEGPNHTLGDLRPVLEADEDPYEAIMAMKKAEIAAGNTEIQLDDDNVMDDMDGLVKRVVKLSRRPTLRELPVAMDPPIMSARRSSTTNLMQQLSIEVNAPPRQRASSVTSPPVSSSSRKRKSSSKRRPPKRKCSPWLKKLLEYLYEDLAVLYSWHQELDQRRERRRQKKAAAAAAAKSPTRKKTSNKGGGTAKKEHHSIDINDGKNNNNNKDDDDGDDGSSSDSDASSSSSSSTSSTDSSAYGDDHSVCAWLAYASLALRLHRRSDCETAFREALKEDRQCLSAWKGLLELYAEAGFIRPALVAAGELCNLDMKEYPYRDVAPKCVITCITKLIASKGFQKVFDVFVELPRMDGCNNFLGKFFEHATELKIDGYNR